MCIRVSSVSPRAVRRAPRSLPIPSSIPSADSVRSAYSVLKSPFVPAPIDLNASPPGPLTPIE